MRMLPKQGIYGVKPYNPILGEQFYCYWKHRDSKTEFHAEQVSHHPPISAAHLLNKKKKLEFNGWIQPKIFLGFNNVYTALSGLYEVVLDGKRYDIQQVQLR